MEERSIMREIDKRTRRSPTNSSLPCLYMFIHVSPCEEEFCRTGARTARFVGSAETGAGKIVVSRLESRHSW